jgi:ABC-type taurine transport system ATPase subunit
VAVPKTVEAHVIVVSATEKLTVTHGIEPTVMLASNVVCVNDVPRSVTAPAPVVVRYHAQSFVPAMAIVFKATGSTAEVVE